MSSIREEDGLNVLDGTDHWTITPSKQIFVTTEKKLHLITFMKTNLALHRYMKSGATEKQREREKQRKRVRECVCKRERYI